MTNLVRPIVHLVKEYREEFPLVLSNYSKVKKTLRTFAESQGKALPKLLLLDICNERNHHVPSKALYSHIFKLLNKNYGDQSVTRIKRILEIFSPTHSDDDESLPDVSDIPPPLRDKLELLPREYDESRQHVPKSLLSDPEYRKNRPLTRNGRIMLQVILEAFAEIEISEKTSVLDLDARKLRERIKSLCHESRYVSICTSLYTFFRKVRAQEGERERESECIFEKLPPKLKEQCEIFLKTAPVGINDFEMQRRAVIKGVSVEKLSQKTINSYFSTFVTLLSKIEIPYDENMDITSFLKIETKKVIDETGFEISYPYNPLVEKIRDIERNRESDYKRAGYDSGMFADFLNAIKSIAAFNGIFGYHESFRLSYRAKTDKQTRERRKNQKRRIYNLEFFDKEIERLYIEVEQIIKDKSFINDKKKRSSKLANRNLRKCIFFVMLTMLRYLGVRQQLLRHCVVGENIIFRKDGRIDFYWCEDLNKNKVEIYGYFDKDEHPTHKLMIEVLNLYYENIYPYLQKIAVDKDSNQLFRCLNPSGQTRVFKTLKDTDKLRNSDFGSKFSLWAHEFLETGDIEKKCKDRIHTHLFRSLCVTWIHVDCGVSSRNSASFIGDSEKTMFDSYLSKSKSHCFNDALKEANKNHKNNQAQIADVSEPLLNLLDQSLKKQSELEAEIRRLKKQIPKKPRKKRLNI